MTTAYYLWEDVQSGTSATAGPAPAQEDLGQLLDLLRADLHSSIRPQRDLRLGLPMRDWLRRIPFVHGN